ncbi:MAG: DUF1186 domain-containing protein, partial [Candidatus Hydrogenedentes bacterium]|nr:DUF1186 domain-containing protein [Candidatus Hydrogenedentota bacterium]
PHKEVKEAIRTREEITPALLLILQETDEWMREHGCDEEADRKGFSCLYALHLLAQFPETRAYPLVISLAKLPEEALDFLIGDILTETLDRILASVCDGDISLIKGLIENPDVNEHARSAALSALNIMVAVGDKPRDEIMDYYKSLFNGGLERSSSAVWNELIYCSTRLHPEEVYEEIAAAYDDGLSCGFFMKLKDVDRIKKISQEKVLQRLSNATYGYIDNTIRELQFLGCVSKDRPTPPAPAAQTPPTTPTRDFHGPGMTLPPEKTSPNAPCPCGSGRKFKKCCGRIT